MSGATRFGLVGTGYWARQTHLCALLAADGVEVAGVWGRDPVKTADVAATVHRPGGAPVIAYADPDAMFADVDAVAFAVPPDVQAYLAVRAAEAGCHLLLEKPTALTIEAADLITTTAATRDVASIVFVTARFQRPVRRWLTEVIRDRDWTGATARWVSSALTDGGPFDTPWRRNKGGLWDVGPHALSVLIPTLGPVLSVVATGDLTGTTVMDLVHAGGATSRVTLSIAATPDEAGPSFVELTAPGATATMPPGADPAHVALGLAVEELLHAAGNGIAHPLDAAFGRDLVAVLVDAERQLAEV